MSYDATYYERIREGCKRSAEAVVPLIYDAVQPQAVVDVGCGEGWWGKAFKDRGCEVVGVEYGDVEPVIATFKRDISRQPILDYDGKFDLAVCLEVAEHLPPARAPKLIEDLCDLAPVVLFSAAIPDQGGEGHLNEQWPTYWADLFERQGYELSYGPRWDIWDDHRVDSWYRQNLAIAAKNPMDHDRWFCDHPSELPYPVVHPAFMADLMAFIRNMAQLGRIEWP